MRGIEAIEWQGASGQDAWLSATLTADGFLRHMVRNIVGTLVDVGLGRWPPDVVGEILASGNRARAGRNAPAHGLFLVRVQY